MSSYDIQRDAVKGHPFRMLARCLFSRKEVAESRGEKGRNVAHLAARYGNALTFRVAMVCVPRLLAERDSDGRTPADCAAKRGSRAILSMLRKRNPCYLSLTDGEGNGVAHHLVLDYLSQVRGIVNDPEKNHVQAYDEVSAVQEKFRDSFMYLELIKPDLLGDRNKKGQTPLDLAYAPDLRTMTGYMSRADIHRWLHEVYKKCGYLGPQRNDPQPPAGPMPQASAS
jgi:ankyrin repeat protein